MRTRTVTSKRKKQSTSAVGPWHSRLRGGSDGLQGSKDILKAEPRGFPDRLDVGCGTPYLLSWRTVRWSPEWSPGNWAYLLAQPHSDRAMRRKIVVGFLSWVLEPGKGASRPSLWLWEIHCQMSFSAVFLAKCMGFFFAKIWHQPIQGKRKGAHFHWPDGAYYLENNVVLTHMWTQGE